MSPIQPHHLEALRCIKCYDAQNEQVPSSRETQWLASQEQSERLYIFLFRFLHWKSLRCLFASSTSTSFCIFIILGKAAVPKLLI